MGEGDLRRVAADSFRSLASGASRHIISGDTTAAEVSRVVGRAFWMDLAKAYDAPPPDLNELFGRVDSDSEHRTALLLTGATDAFDDAFRRRLGESWFTPHVAGSPEAARRLLEEHDEIELVVLDLDPDASDATLLDDVAAYRRELAWSRLPAVVRTPPGRDELEAPIREAGATSRFLPQDAGVDALVALVNEALSSDSDYQWGRQDSQAEAEGDPAG